MTFTIKLPDSGQLVEVFAEFDGYEPISYIINEPKNHNEIDFQSLSEEDRRAIIIEADYLNSEEIRLEDQHDYTHSLYP